MTYRSRSLPAGLLATLVVALVGCGGGSATTSAFGESGSRLVRAGALAFVAVDSDLGSSQWQQVDTLSKKFPGRDQALARLRQGLADNGVDYDKDVKPALGPEVDMVVISGPGANQTSAVGLTKPKDPAKFKALIAKLNASDQDLSEEPAVYKEIDEGWYAVSESQAQIDAALRGSGGEGLSDDSMFKAALEKLPGEALVKAYVDGLPEDRKVVRDEERRDGDRDDVVEHLRPGGPEGDEFVEGVSGEARGAARLGVTDRSLGVAQRCGSEEYPRDHEDNRGQPKREDRRDPEGVVDRRADVAVGGREQRRRPEDALQALLPAPS